MTAPVAVLFARADSIYKTLPGADVWDAERDARRWPGGHVVIAHPPCRSWGTLRAFAKPAPGEKDLAPWAVDQVREWGGVLEHPQASSLWPAKGLPRPTGARRIEVDSFGGWTLPIVQHWWGHRAEKKTWLYIVGCSPADVPTIPLVLGEAPRVITNGKMAGGKRRGKGDPRCRSEVTKAEREHTPPALAVWLLELARRCQRA